MIEWYESQRVIAHDQIVLKITNDNFAPEILTADPHIIEWSNRAVEDARSRSLTAIDTRAKQAAEDQFQTSLVQYELTHENDLARLREDYQQSYLKIQDHWREKLVEAEAQLQKQHQELIEKARSHNPVIVDPTARKKRRGSVSTINSPIVTKSQPFSSSSIIPVSDADHSSNHPQTLPPAPLEQPVLSNPPTTTTLDPMTQIMNMMSKQFEKLTERLDKLEANNTNEYMNWNNPNWDNASTWNQPKTDLVLAETKFEDPYIANIDYDNAELYDDPPNDHTFVGVSDPPIPEPEPHPDPDSDCVILSGPPTPTAPKTAPSGFRPPERAQRVDFVSGKLATDSFGIPVGGRCNANGTISFSNTPSRINKPKKPSAPSPEHMIPYTNDQLRMFTKDDIITHALLAFNHSIPRKCNKAQVVQQYQIAVANSRKPGARQSTLSFAAAASKAPRPNPTQKQTTPSVWSRTPTPPPKRNQLQINNNSVWVIRPRT